MQNGKRDLTKHRKKAAEIVSKLNFEQKLIAFAGNAKDMESLGLPKFWIGGECAHGVQARNDQAGELGNPAYTTVFPNPIGMAATWDKELMHQIGTVAGTEARSLYMEGKNGALCVWAPTVDMERDPRWGRNEEGYGEDPHLTSRLAGEYILGMAGDDETYVRCGASLKHFYGNNVEVNRNTADSNISEELKETYYVKVFKDTIDYAMPLAAMSSYNLVNGVPSTVNPELRTKLKAWGLTHIVADAGGLTYTVERQHVAKDEAEGAAMSIKAGVDYFPDPVAGDNMHQRNAVREAIKRGLMTEEDLDASLTDKFTAYSILGLFENDELPPVPFSKEDYNMSKVDSAENRAVARRAAAECIVLLKNENETLPLKKEDSVILAGPFADRCPLDWYSGFTTKMVTIKEGMEAAAGKEIPDATLFPCVRLRLPKAAGGKDAYAGLDQDGRVIAVEKEKAELFRIMLWDDTKFTIRAMSNNKLLTSQKPEELEEKDPIYEGSPEYFACKDECFSWFFWEAFSFLDEKDEVISFTEENVLRFWEDERITAIRNWDGKIPAAFETVEDVPSQIEKLADADKVVACFGLHPIINCKEDYDRKSIELPPFQRRMLSLLQEKYDKVILLLSANAPLAVVPEQTSGRIPAILWACQGSEEYGNGVADVIYAKKGPAGRLPQTWYASDDQLADINDYDIKKTKMTYLYFEGEPLYRFGYGLTYSTFETAFADVGDEQSCLVAVRNTGKLTSDYVVAVYEDADKKRYLQDEQIPVGARLIGFERVKDVAPGQTMQVRIRLGN